MCRSKKLKALIKATLSSSHIYSFVCARVFTSGNLDRRSSAYFYERYPSCPREERVGVPEPRWTERRSPDVGKSQRNARTQCCRRHVQQPLIFTGRARATGLHLDRRKREPYLFERYTARFPCATFSLRLFLFPHARLFLLARCTSTARRKIFQRRLKAAVGKLTGNARGMRGGLEKEAARCVKFLGCDERDE